MLDHLTVGRGEKIAIVIHGFLGRARQLLPLAKRMAKRAPSLSFVLPDLPGHGGSPPLAPNAALADLARAILALADRIGAQRFSIVGHSLGGRTALALALSHADRLERIVVLDVSASDLTTRPSPISGMMQALLRAPDRTPDRASMRSALIALGAAPKEADALMVHVEGGAWTIDRRALADLRTATMGTDLWAAVDRRVALVYGTESSFVKAEDVERYRRTGAGILAIPGAGHLLHLEAPAAVSEAIVNLLEKTD